MHVSNSGTAEGSSAGVSPAHVFPLTPMSVDGRFMVGRRVRSMLDKLVSSGGNMVVACLNWMHGGQQQRDPPVLTAAHRRVHSRIGGALEAMVF